MNENRQNGRTPSRSWAWEGLAYLTSDSHINAMTEQGILIAGGYGVVGQRIAAELAPDYRVIVAGRHLEQAKATAAAIGHGVRSRLIDVTVEASIGAAREDVATVVSCIDQPRRRLLHTAIERGLQYTDVTPHLTDLGRGAAYEKIGAAAQASGNGPGK